MKGLTSCLVVVYGRLIRRYYILVCLLLSMALVLQMLHLIVGPGVELGFIHHAYTNPLFIELRVKAVIFNKSREGYLNLHIVHHKVIWEAPCS